MTKHFPDRTSFFLALGKKNGVSVLGVANAEFHPEGDEEATEDFVCLELSFMYKPCNDSVVLERYEQLIFVLR